MKNENQPYIRVGKGQFELSCEPLRTADVYAPTEGNENERSSNIQPPYESEAKHSITSIFDVKLDQFSSTAFTRLNITRVGPYSSPRFM